MVLSLKISGVHYAVLLSILITACGSTQNNRRDSANTRSDPAFPSTADCLNRETLAIAPLPIDLDTAAHAVLARCDYPGSLERSLAAKNPGYGDYIHERLQKEYAGILESTKEGIALVRAKSASSVQSTSGK
jgi:hypothetical protein